MKYDLRDATNSVLANHGITIQKHHERQKWCLGCSKIAQNRKAVTNIKNKTIVDSTVAARAQGKVARNRRLKELGGS